jgi:3-hydroxyacyl-[acyl-carrier-protein] dehydratase
VLTNDVKTHDAALCIERGHPALAGHFPGRPIVPAVLLLDCVMSEAERWLGRTLSPRALSQAKFTSPLLPEQHAQLRLALLGAELRFNLTRDGENVAQGAFRLAAGIDA